MTTPQFIAWLDGKMDEHDKLVPPPAVLERELADKIARRVRADITERILREAGLDDQVTAAIAAIEKPDADALSQGIEDLFRQEPEREWRDHIDAVVAKLTARGVQ